MRRKEEKIFFFSVFWRTSRQKNPGVVLVNEIGRRIPKEEKKKVEEAPVKDKGGR